MSNQASPTAESTSPVSIPKFPRIEYQEKPVITTDLLAMAYGTDTVRVRQNFNKNRSRFTDGKHYFSVSGNDLKDLADGVAKSYAMDGASFVPNLRGPSVTLYTKHGAALHAKMLNTDTAWEVYEGMVDFYFDSMEGKVALPATKEQRRPLVEAVRTWVKLANADYAQAHKQVNAVVGVASVEEMSQDQVAIGLAWVRQRIDSLVKATENKAIAEAEDVMVSLERLGMIIRKVREITKGLPVATEVALMRFFLNKSGYPTG
jgi:hypothetical protein